MSRGLELLKGARRCGKVGAAATQEEAERVKENHGRMGDYGKAVEGFGRQHGA